MFEGPSCLLQLTLLVAMTTCLTWKQLREGRVYSGSGLEAAVHQGEEGMSVSKGLELGAGTSWWIGKQAVPA